MALRGAPLSGGEEEPDAISLDNSRKRKGCPARQPWLIRRGEQDSGSCAGPQERALTKSRNRVFLDAQTPVQSRRVIVLLKDGCLSNKKLMNRNRLTGKGTLSKGRARCCAQQSRGSD